MRLRILRTLLLGVAACGPAVADDGGARVEDAVYCAEYIGAGDLLVYVPVENGCLRLYFEVSDRNEVVVDSGWGELVRPDCRAMEDPFYTLVALTGRASRGHTVLFITGEGTNEAGQTVELDVSAGSAYWRDDPVMCD